MEEEKATTFLPLELHVSLDSLISLLFLFLNIYKLFLSVISCVFGRMLFFFIVSSSCRRKDEPPFEIRVEIRKKGNKERNLHHIEL